MWYIYPVEYYSTIKRYTCESVLKRWMDLETIIPSELSEEKDKYCILTHMYRISKNGSEEFIYRAAMAQERKEMIGA